MTTQVVPGQLIATRDPEDGAKEAARRMTKAMEIALAARGTATLALSGGTTPLPAYRLLAAAPLPWEQIKVFWVDERAVPEDHERSNARAVREAFSGAKLVHMYPMRAASGDLDASARDYEVLLRREVRPEGGLPALDLVILGLGDDGHTASLFPGEPAVNEELRLVVPVPAKGQREARMTMTRPVLANSRATLILAFGKSKNEALEKAWSLGGDPMDAPARLTRTFRGGVTWIVDRAAGGIT